MSQVLAVGAAALLVLIFAGFKLYMLGLPTVCQ